jgi:hypothetical protein
MNPSIARFISFIFNPVLVLVFVPFLLLYKTTKDIFIAINWTGYTVVFLLIMTVFIIYFVKKKVFTDMDVSKREQRPLLFFVSIVFAIVYLAGLFFLHGPYILFVITFGITMGIFVASIINTRIKASIHVATIAALIFTLAIVYGGLYTFSLLLIPLVAWARITIKRHTLSETIVGGILGVLLSLFIYGLVKIFPY